MDSNNSELTMPNLQAHIIKTIVGAAATSVVVTMLGLTAFYHQTKNTLSNHSIQIRSNSEKISDYTKTLSSVSTKGEVTETEMKNLEARMGSMESTQKEIYSLLIQVASDQKLILNKK